MHYEDLVGISSRHLDRFHNFLNNFLHLRNTPEMFIQSMIVFNQCSLQVHRDPRE